MPGSSRQTSEPTQSLTHTIPLSLFEKSLATNCKSGYIAIDTAPVAINQNLLRIYPIDQKDPPQSLRCSVWDVNNKTKYNIFIGMDNSGSNTLNITNKDDFSSYYEEVPFYNDGTVELDVFLAVAADIPPKDTSVGITSIKTLTMKDGEKVYAFYSNASAIPNTDPRLQSLYHQLERPNGVIHWPSNDDIKKEFFSNSSNLQEPEKQL